MKGLRRQRQRSRVEKHRSPRRMTRILVDRFIYQGFAMPQADTPPVIRTYANPLQDQDEKVHCFMAGSYASQLSWFVSELAGPYAIVEVVDHDV